MIWLRRHLSCRIDCVTAELRKSGLSFVGDIPWGTHFCHFYETKDDLLNTIVPYLKAGLENNEACIWAIRESLDEEEVQAALRLGIADVDGYLANGRLEIVSYAELAIE